MLGDAARFRVRQAPNLGEAEHDIAQRGQMRKQIVALEDHADPRALAGKLAAGQAAAPLAASAITEQIAIEPDLAALDIPRGDRHSGSSVVLPEPLAPMIETTSAGQNVEIDAAQTACAPKDLVRPLMVRIGSKQSSYAQPEAALEPPAAGADDEIDEKVEAAAERVELHRLEGAADDLLGGQQELADADRREQRRRLDDLDGGVDEIRRDLADRLRHQDVDEHLAEGQPDRARGVGLSRRDGEERAAERLAHMSSAENGESRSPAVIGPGLSPSPDGM